MSESKRLVVGCIIGTRPEIIKMVPIIAKLKETSWATVFIVNTAQHRSLLDGMLNLFDLMPDADLDIMTANQTLSELTGNLCKKIDHLVREHHFDVLLAAGDTTTVFISSLIAFYHHIPFGHVEAGLRTYNSREPFPEEINRVLTAPLAKWHFAPTMLEKENLIRENINPANIIVTGNPVIDTLYWTIKNKSDTSLFDQWSNIIIVTAHRRENFGQNVRNICQAVIELSQKFEHIDFVFPVHPNPQVQNDIHQLLNEKDRIHLLPPLRYDQFAHLMSRAVLILTDSGGIQEEAPALGKPVVVLRNITERPAILHAGVGMLVGTEINKVIDAVSELLTDKNKYAQMSQGISPYGDGHAAERIVSYLERCLITNKKN